MIVAGTGHRPDKITVGSRNAYDTRVAGSLRRFAGRILWRLQAGSVITGMALGWDTALAEAALDLGLPFVAYIPFRGQESRWPRESQERYRRLLEQAAGVVVCAEGSYAVWKMQHRNKRMVDDCQLLLALWNGTDGGTANCVRYAESVNRPIEHAWPQWAAAVARVTR